MNMDPRIGEWYFNTGISVLVMLMVYLYYQVTGFKRKDKTWYFILAIFLFILAECSPLHSMGMRYFSIHMIAHVTELLICGPLLMLSLQRNEQLPVNDRLAAISSFFLRHSWVAWACGVGIMWFWHIPAVFNGAMNAMSTSFSAIPALHGGSMLMAGMIFSWPVLGPVKDLHISPLSGIIYLFTACISCSLLGLLITFAPLHTWQRYQLEDQQAAGLVMWVPCCFVYLGGCLFLLYRWFSQTEHPRENVIINLQTSLTDHDGR